jgi:hypothetical protein
MRHLFAFTMGTLVTLIAATYLAPQPTHTTETITEVRDRIIIEEVMTTIDLDRIRNTSRIDPELEEQLLMECVYAIHEATGDNLAGAILYIERYWQGDACAALEHYHTHAWY